MPACAVCGYVTREAFKFCPECGAAAVPSNAEQRKIVTVLFCDVVASTVLGESTDAEVLRALLARYFSRMNAIVERHGGTVEKFIGDAVMAVFGIPVAHEDDALRACRAAVEMREALPALAVEGRIGVVTGEVVTGTEERLATGDAVNVAARLQQAAQPGEVLVGEETLALVSGAADVEAVEPLTLKGKAEPVPAFRLLAVHEVPERRPETRFVGRERELAAIHAAWERALAERRCELVTILGEPGVGKSRLVAEALASLEAQSVHGRCLPYGEGITYWPVVESLKQLGALPSDETAAAAIGSLLGDTDAATSAEEIAWAVRKLLEEQAPLVVVFDDIQWGEETFLDLIEHISLLSSDASILLLCLSRPELADRRPTWPVALRLGPLDDAEVDELIVGRLSADVRERIAHAAGGNPLFVEEMLAMALETNGDVRIPPTLRALLAARLDQLEPAERTILELGAIEGEIFHRCAVQALETGDAQVTPRLAALVRKGLIRPDRPQIRGDDAFRFHHVLIRDAAYDALPKRSRAELHARFTSWLQQHGRELVELDELLGYHLEQACGYRTEVGMPADADLAAAARQHLTAGGQRAARRQNYEAAARLFERAAALLAPSQIDLALETELGEVLLWTGRRDEGLRRANALVERAVAAGDRVGELCGRIRADVFRHYFEPQTASADLATILEQALPELEAAGDDLALYIAYSARGELADLHGHPDATLAAFERAFTHAQRAGYRPSSMFALRAWCRFAGTTTVSELLAWLDEHESEAGRDQFFRAYRAWSLAKLGQFDEARAIIAAARAEQEERGGGPLLANLTAFESVWIELLAGDPAAAAEFGAKGCSMHEELGEHRFLGSAAGSLAQALYALDRLDDANAWAGRAMHISASTDMWAQMLWRQVRAKVLARSGEHGEAQRLALEAVAIADDTELLDMQGAAYSDLGEVLLLTGKADEATAAFEQALARYKRKGNFVMADRTQARLTELRQSAVAAQRT
jgi:class 3 adenylate cyclase/tetratricopeptide (TPR) repeat protein